MDRARIVERNGEASAVLADNTAGNAERERGRRRYCVGDRHDPAGAIRFETAHPRPRQLNPNDGGSVFCAVKQNFAYAVVVVGLERVEVDLSRTVEYQPQCVRTVEYGGGRCYRERKVETQIVARLVYAGDHHRVRIGWRTPGFGGRSALRCVWRLWRDGRRHGYRWWGIGIGCRRILCRHFGCRNYRRRR